MDLFATTVRDSSSLFPTLCRAPKVSLFAAMFPFSLSLVRSLRLPWLAGLTVFSFRFENHSVVWVDCMGAPMYSRVRG